MKKFLLLTIFALVANYTLADEGMWILKELNRQSAERMKELGFIYPDSLYSETNPSLKDAVIIFDQGCTGVVVSPKGLIFTNHHCGYSAIQTHSSVEHDYLQDGFVSHSFGEEKYTEGMIVQFVDHTEDVTDRMLAAVTSGMDEEKREHVLDSVRRVILKPYSNDQFIQAQVYPYFAGNKYYLVVYKVFRDVRMVFAPPSSIGKFGFDTDNWVWPRHTGDFSVFRVYADKDNNPANYSPDNVPYTPKYFVPVSTAGYSEGDYAMVIGFPGSTERYMTSWGIEQMMESTNKPRIEVREAKQEVWKKAMNASDEIRIKYSSKFARSSNYWKNAIGMNEAIVKNHVLEDKRALEASFDKWVKTHAAAEAKYGDVLDILKNGYQNSMDVKKRVTYFEETLTGIDLLMNTFMLFTGRLKADNPEEIFKDYDPQVDCETMGVLLKLYADRMPSDYYPDVFEKVAADYNNDFAAYARYVFDNTNLTSADKFSKAMADESLMQQDPAMELFTGFFNVLRKVQIEYMASIKDLEKGERLYLAGLMEMQPDKAFYSDANFSQRLTYGSIKGYKPADAVTYNYYTTTKGVLEKEKPGDPEFNVQSYILEDLKKQQWGEYADKDGSMHIGFLSNNDITGGNSGSPVFNGNAELIGLAFDGNWESLSGDILFDNDLQRCINADIRYVLYVIDKMMNCHRLIDELKIVKTDYRQALKKTRVTPVKVKSKSKKR